MMTKLQNYSKTGQHLENIAFLSTMISESFNAMLTFRSGWGKEKKNHINIELSALMATRS